MNEITSVYVRLYVSESHTKFHKDLCSFEKVMAIFKNEFLEKNLCTAWHIITEITAKYQNYRKCHRNYQWNDRQVISVISSVISVTFSVFSGNVGDSMHPNGYGFQKYWIYECMNGGGCFENLSRTSVLGRFQKMSSFCGHCNQAIAKYIFSCLNDM
jgi:hypothetical protein